MYKTHSFETVPHAVTQKDCAKKVFFKQNSITKAFELHFYG